MLTGQGDLSKGTDLRASSNRGLVKVLPQQYSCRLLLSLRKIQVYMQLRERQEDWERFLACSLFTSCLSSPSDQQAGRQARVTAWRLSLPQPRRGFGFQLSGSLWAVQGTLLSATHLRIFRDGWWFPRRWAQLGTSSGERARVEAAACRRQRSPRTAPPHPFLPGCQ